MENKYALVSLSDKSNLSYLVASLKEANYTIVATTSSAAAIKDLGYDVKLVEEITSFPEMLNGRVKTLQPEIHGGILAVRDNQSHVAQMQKFNIQPIDLVVVNLYPFRETIEKPNVTLAEAVENIDIGGPAMIRAAAKNFKFVTVVVNPKHYDEVAEMIAKDGCTTGKFRMQLAQEAFCHTSHYDDCIQEYLTAQLSK